jgi:murein L,D-transpeptidase YcbB/YkuD
VINRNKTFFLLLLSCLTSVLSVAQLSPERIQEFIANDKNIYASSRREFYTLLGYQPAWMNKENEFSRNALFEVLEKSADMGLQETEYNEALIGALKKHKLPLTTVQDSLQAEMSITDAAIHFYTDLAYGNVKPVLGYNGLEYTPACRNIPALLAESIVHKSLQMLPASLYRPLPVMIALENRIQWINNVMADSSYKEVTITSNKVTVTNQDLITKLYQLNIFSTNEKKLPDSTVKQGVREAQRQFSLLADGVLRSTLIQELNIPLAVRLQQLALSLNYYRWLYCLIQNQSVIVVNIPAAYMKVYSQGKIILEMRMIVGKPSTPSSTLASRINEVVLYPYWHVPYSIATKELLPAIKRNPGFINAGNYQVLNKAGNIVDPYSVNWHALSRNYFPYLIRQSTGCDNALGLIKLNFYSPFGIYLHDTPVKSLFLLNKRYFSHGCMRMEKPMELGHLVLKNNNIAIDTLEQKGCLLNQAPVTVHADEQMPVIVWYNPVDLDSAGRLMYYEDVYEKFSWLRKP